MNPAAAARQRLPRVAIDAQILRPAMSGVERAVHSLLKALHETAPEFEFLIYYPRGLGRPSEKDAPNVRYRHPLIPNTFRPLRICWDQAILPLRLRRDHIDLLHAPAYVGPLLSHVPSVLTIYDMIALKFPHLCKRTNVLHYRLIMPPSARRAARIIVPSECTKRDVIALLRVPEEKLRVVPLGVSPAFRPVDDPARLAAMRRRYGLPERYILYLGNLEPKKNLPHLLRAFAEARRSGHITHRLVLAGQKAWRTDELHRTLRKKRLQQSVMLLGGIPEEDLPALYSGASCFVFPSLYEGFGLPPLEAMACGTPVITTRAGALPEVVGNAALTLSSGDTRELRIAVEKVAANQFLRNRLRAYGLERAKQFTWERTAQETVKVYKEVLNEAPHEP